MYIMFAHESAVIAEDAYCHVTALSTTIVQQSALLIGGIHSPFRYFIKYLNLASILGSYGQI